MKKTITLFFIMLSSILVMAQLPVSHVAGKKQALIEEFTGNTCGYCPDGHKISDQITAALPGKAFAINIHAGSYATPSGSATSKDFRTTDGTAILALPNMKVTGFPAGSVNRKVPTSGSPQSAGGFAMSRSYWSANVNTIITQNTYVNIAGQATLNPITRVMTINMEAYYTSNSPVSANRISIALVQDDIIAYQGGSSYYPAMIVGNDYRHNHALRDILTSGASGETMTGANTSGTTWSKSYTYTVAATYPSSGTKAIPAVLADLEVIAFITETTDNVVAVCKVPVNITTEVSENVNYVNYVNIYPNPMDNAGVLVFTLSQHTNASMDVVNSLGQVVKSEKLNGLNLGENLYEFNTSDLSNGIYFVNLKYDAGMVTKKITVIK